MAVPEKELNNHHANLVAELAVKRVFAILGVDIDKPSDVEEFRENLRFGATLRRAADRGWLAVITVVVGGIMLAIWTGAAKLLRTMGV